MSLYFNVTAAAALGLMDECRNDAPAAEGVTFNDSPTAGAAGGADASPEPSAQQDTTPGPDVHTDAPAAAAADGDDDEPDLKDDAHQNKPWANDPDFKRAMNRARRLQRRLAEAKPIVEKVRAFGIGDKLEEVVTNARRYSDAEPTLRRLASGEDPSRAAESREPDSYEPPPFDRKSVPFDDNDPGGKWIADFAERHHNAYHNLVGAVKSLMREVNEQRSERQTEHRTREVTDWKAEISKAAQQLPEEMDGFPVRQVFADAVVGAFHQAKVRRTKINPQAVINHYLAKYKPRKTDPAAAAAATAQQRIAENNRSRPSSGAFSGGTPTGARDITNERIGDVSRRMVGNRYLGRR
jgi:hypothetical protein